MAEAGSQIRALCAPDVSRQFCPMSEYRESENFHSWRQESDFLHVCACFLMLIYFIIKIAWINEALQFFFEYAFNFEF